jgi:hypothetical protein
MGISPTKPRGDCLYANAISKAAVKAAPLMPE